jgi:hypothetical protein
MIDPVPKKVVEDLLAGLKEIAGLLVGPVDQERVTKAWCSPSNCARMPNRRR